MKGIVPVTLAVILLILSHYAYAEELPVFGYSQNSAIGTSTTYSQFNQHTGNYETQQVYTNNPNIITSENWANPRGDN